MELQKSMLGESVKPISKKCAVCITNGAKYTCPRCAIRTCSLSCCKSHKLAYNCSGKRDVAAYVDKGDYNYFSFLSDYRFLESIDRLNDRLARDISENRRVAKSRLKVQCRIMNMARSLGINYRYSRSPLLTRTKVNQTHIVGEESPYISWTLEFCLVDPLLTDSLSNPVSFHQSLPKPIHIIIHNCSPSLLISEIWNTKVTNLSSESQDSLANPELVFASDPSTPNPSVTSWTLPLGEELPYFYIECFDKTTKHFSKHQILASSTSLIDVLKYENYLVREFPTIWVSQKQFLS
nr:box C:D snoRNA protein 1 [Hymenolepis microstoma]